MGTFDDTVMASDAGRGFAVVSQLLSELVSHAREGALSQAVFECLGEACSGVVQAH